MAQNISDLYGGAPVDHIENHPAPTNRDTRNAAAGAGDAGDAHAAIVTGNPHNVTAFEAGAVDAVTYGIHGMTDRAETTIAFDDATYTFTLAKTGANWSYYRDGVKYTITEDQTVQLSGTPPAAGYYFIYIDAIDGSLTAGSAVWTLADSKVPVAWLSWNDGLTPKFKLADERHNSTWNKSQHAYEHLTFGTRMQARGAIAGYQVAQSSPIDAHNTYSLAETKIRDEDFPHTLGALAAGGPYHIAYRTAIGAWAWLEQAIPFKHGTYIQYDNAGTMTDAAANRFVSTYVIGTNCDGNCRFTVIPGQAQHSTLAAARAEVFSSLDLDGINVLEASAMYQVIWETSASYSTTGKCRMAAEPIEITGNLINASSTPGLGTMSTQNADDVNITGGTLAGVTFTDYPLLPEAAPTADREAVPKGYLGTAATLGVGTAANNIVQLDGDAKLPAVDGSQLTNLPGGGGGGIEVNTETLSADKTIADGDPTIQLLTPNGEHRNVLLPATPAKDCEFVIVNAGAHNITHYLEVKLDGDTNYFTRLYAHAAARLCFDVTSGLWTCYGPGWHRTRTGANTYVGGEAMEIGYLANGSSNGAAVGGRANGSSNGAAVGALTNGSDTGAAVGMYANGSDAGAAVGYSANGSSSGAAVGRTANGTNFGAAVGRTANGTNFGAAVGWGSNCNSKQYGSAIAALSQQQRYGGHARSGDHLDWNEQSVEEVQWKGQTTTATATEIFLHGVSANRCTILASSATVFNGSAVAKQAATGNTKAWTFQGCIKRDASNNTVLVGAVTSTVIAEDAGASAWVLTIEADDTNEAIKVTVTGEAAKTIDWGVEARLLDRLN